MWAPSRLGISIHLYIHTCTGVCVQLYVYMYIHMHVRFTYLLGTAAIQDCPWGLAKLVIKVIEDDKLRLAAYQTNVASHFLNICASIQIHGTQTNMYTYTYTSICVYIYMYPYTHTYVSVCVYIYTHTRLTAKEGEKFCLTDLLTYGSSPCAAASSRMSRLEAR